ncbi:SpoIIE family protein phosphatase [Frankia sp. AgB32]|nr:SpoIIE family protein phosphatase [Frankia sp. AgB32]
MPVLPPGWPMVPRPENGSPSDPSRDVIDGFGPRRLPPDGLPVPGTQTNQGTGPGFGSGLGRGSAAASGATGVDPGLATYALLDALFAQAPVGLALLDRSGRFVRVNDTLARLDRRAARDHLGRTVSEVLGDTGQELDALLGRVLHTGEPMIDLEIGVAGPAGAPARAWLASWFPVTDPQLGPVGVAFVALDVTGMQVAERERMRAEGRYRALVDAAGSDVFHATADGSLDVDLPGWRTVTGQPAGELAGAGWLAGVHPDDRDQVARLWRGALEHGAPFDAEFRLSTPTEGSPRVVGARVLPVPATVPGNGGEARPAEWLGVLRDLSAERVAEAGRTDAEQRADAADARAIAAEQRAGTAEERAGEAEQHVDEARQRATAAEQRAAEAEERAGETEQRAQAAQRRAEEAEQRVGSSAEQAASADARVQAAVDRAEAADQRAEAAVDRAEAADRRAEEAVDRAEGAERRAQTAQRQAEQAVEQAAAADQRAGTAGEQTAAASRRAAAAVEQAEAADARLEAGGRFSVALAAASTVDQVIAAVLDVGGQAARAVARGVALVDPERDELRFLRSAGEADAETSTEPPAGSWPDVALGAVHPVAEVVRGGRALFLSDRRELLTRWPVAGLADAVAAAGEQAWAMLPLVAADGAAFGVVTFGFPAARPFPPADRAHLTGVAAAAARAIERARGHDRLLADAAEGVQARTAAQAERAARETADHRLDLLTRVTTTVSAADDPRQALRAFADLLVTEIADVCAVHLVSAGPATRAAVGEHAASGDGAPAGEPAAPAADPAAAAEAAPRLVPFAVVTAPTLSTAPTLGDAAPAAAWSAAAATPTSPLRATAADGQGRLLVHPDGDGDLPADLARWLRQLGAHTTAVLPVWGAGGIAAVVSLTAARDRAPFTTAELEYLGELAARAGVACIRLDRDRAVHGDVAELHETLRGAPPAAPSGLQVATRYLPAGDDGDAGGEWSDVIDLGAGRFALVIGEARGRGVAAAAAMGQLRAAVRVCARLDLPPGEVLALLDGIVADLPGEQVATCIYAIAEIDTGVLTLASAGHPPPLVIAPDGLVSRLYMAVGSPLGVARADLTGPADATEYTVRLGQGYLIALFTDGLVRGGGRAADAGVSDLAAVLARGDGPRADLDALVTAACVGLGRDGEPASEDTAVALLFARLPGEAVAGQSLLDVTVDGAEGLRAVRAQGRLALENQGGLPGDVVDSVVLVLSELTSNALRHGRPTCSVRLRRFGDRAVVEVADGGGRLPRRRLAAPEDEAGRGLDLVSRIAARHGVRMIVEGKVVWAEIDLVARPDGPSGP